MGTLQNAKILLAVQRLGSISKAAQELNISQPTVSVILKKIESEVEGDIYYHNERPIKLTPLGRMLSHQFEKFVELDDQTKNYIKTFKKGFLPSFRIGTVDSFCPNINPYFVPNLLEHTQKLVIEEGSTLELADWIKKNRIDIAIMNMDLQEEEGIVSELIFTEEYVIVLPKSLLMHANSTVGENLELMSRLSFIYLSNLSFDKLTQTRFLNNLGIKPPKSIELDDFSTVCQIVNSGHGWTLLTPLELWIGRDFLKNITIIRPPYTRFYKPFYFVHKQWMMPKFENLLISLLLSAIMDKFVPVMTSRFPELAPYLKLSESIAKRDFRELV